MFVHSLPTHTIQEKNPMGTKQKQAIRKKTGFWRMRLAHSNPDFCPPFSLNEMDGFLLLLDFWIPSEAFVLLCNGNFTASWKLPLPGHSDILLPELSWHLSGFSGSASFGARLPLPCLPALGLSPGMPTSVPLSSRYGTENRRAHRAYDCGRWDLNNVFQLESILKRSFTF